MRSRVLLLACVAISLMMGAGRAQLQSSGPLQSFQSDTSQTTAAFQAPDSWEVRWHGMRNLNISVLAADGSVVVGGAGRSGSLYLAKGGAYHLLIDYAPLPPAPDNQQNPQPQQNQNQAPQTPFNSVTSGNYGDTPSQQNTPPRNQPQPYIKNPKFWAQQMRARMTGPYTVEVYPASTQGPADQAATASMTPENFYSNAANPEYKLPVGSTPSTAPVGGGPAVAASATPAATPTASPAATPPAAAAAAAAAPASLTDEQARAVVLIKGDKAEGTGFLIKTFNGPAVLTNIHVIADNPNVKITTNTGAVVTVLSQKCAADRDLALLAIQDAGYSYMEMAPDISKVVLPGDQVITPGNSEGGEVMLNTSGKVLGVGPERIEIDNPIFHGNSGGPVFHPKSGKVLGVVTYAMPVDLSDDLDKSSFANRNSAIGGKMRYFALRIDTVTQWIDVDPHAFGVETAFLERFQKQSERLDAYLNRKDSSNGGENAGSGSGDDAKIYLEDEKIMKADSTYTSTGSSSDISQHLDALRDLLFALQSVADTDVDKIQNMNAFYAFDQDRAREELDYRKALKAELDSIGNNVERLGTLPRTNN